MTTEMDPPSGLTNMLASQRSAFSGLEDLPVDEPDLDGQETLPVDEPPPPATAIPLPLDPTVPEPAPTGDAATQARLALLEAELAVLRAAPAPTTPVTPATPLTVDETVYARIADRFQANFASMAEQAVDESDQQFEQRRARGFAETIVAAVYEDLLPTEAVQARFQPTVERVAQQVAQQTVRNDRETTTLQQQQDSMISQAVQAARQAGYDVHPPLSPTHAKSQESVLFWNWAAQQVDPQLPIDQQITKTLALMPQKAPVVPAAPAAPPRPQPMGRQGAGPTPAPAGQGQEYGGMTMAGMLQQHQQVRRVGTA
jgi:hypothetical protein